MPLSYGHQIFCNSGGCGKEVISTTNPNISSQLDLAIVVHVQLFLVLVIVGCFQGFPPGSVWKFHLLQSLGSKLLTSSKQLTACQMLFGHHKVLV